LPDKRLIILWGAIRSDTSRDGDTSQSETDKVYFLPLVAVYFAV
jgi:hypothetical protein